MFQFSAMVQMCCKAQAERYDPPAALKRFIGVVIHDRGIEGKALEVCRKNNRDGVDKVRNVIEKKNQSNLDQIGGALAQIKKALSDRFFDQCGVLVWGACGRRNFGKRF